MKKHNCDICHKTILVYDEYEPKFCCAGRTEDEYGCMGAPINPVFCDECEIFLGWRQNNEN